MKRNRKMEKEVGLIEDEELKGLIAIAKSKKLSCLPLIALEDDTIFNQKQIQELQCEVKKLQDDPNINKNALNIIAQSLKEAAQTPHLYLIFCCE